MAGRQSAQKCQVSYGLVSPTYIYCARYHSTIPVYDELVALLANELNPISFPGTECSRHGAVRKRATGAKWEKDEGEKGAAGHFPLVFFLASEAFSPWTLDRSARVPGTTLRRLSVKTKLYSSGQRALPVSAVSV